MSFPLDEIQRWMARVRAQQIPVEEIPTPTAVTIVSDFTASQSAEPFECRALSAIGNTVGGPLTTLKLQLFPMARPCVLDLLRFNLPPQGGAQVYSLVVSIGPNTFFAPGFSPLDIVDIGGVIHRAVVDHSWTLPVAGFSPNVAIPLADGVADVPSSLAFRALVPVGSAFTAQLFPAQPAAPTPPYEVDLTLLWREIV